MARFMFVFIHDFVEFASTERRRVCLFVSATHHGAKENSKLKKLRVHMVGCIFHSVFGEHGKDIYYGFDLFEWPHDPNLTVNIMCLGMFHMWVRKGHSLPPVWYLRMDNCVRENKNNVVFGFLALLVEHCVFKKVK